MCASPSIKEIPKLKKLDSDCLLEKHRLKVQQSVNYIS
jgi:hypothetical protein